MPIDLIRYDSKELNKGNNLKKNKNSVHFFWADCLRVLSTIFVFVVHTVSYDTSIISVADLTYGSLARFCVPIFLMLSGALLLGNDLSISDFFLKRFSRIIFPFLFWSFLYIGNNIFQKILRTNQLSISLIGDIFEAFRDQPSYHLWYIYIIIGIYVFMPIMGKAIKNLSRREIEFYLAIWFLVQVFSLPALSYFRINIDLTYFSGYLGYVVLGYYLSQYEIKSSSFKAVSFFVIGFLATLGGTWYLLVIKSSAQYYLYEYLTPNVIIMSAGMFIIIRQNVFGIRVSIKWKKVVTFFSKYSYGAYLCHILILIALRKASIDKTGMSHWLTIPITSLVTLLLSTTVVWITNNLPFGKHISG